MSGALEGKLAVVTGATSGIGAALARRLYGEGATVVGIGRRHDALAQEAMRAEGRFIAVCADLADPRGRAQAIGELETCAPRIDLLINNAGEAAYAAPLELGAAGWRHLFEINVLAAVELAIALAPRIAPGGHLINVSSVAARFAANARFAAYGATKAALDRATEALRLELDPLVFGAGAGARHSAFIERLDHPALRDALHGYHVLESDTRHLSVTENYMLGMVVLCAQRSFGPAAMFAKTLLHLGVPRAKLLEAVARLAMWIGGIPAAEAAAHIQKAIADYEQRGLASLEAWFPPAAVGPR
jgi:NAD(P)-dependent dehydrogenase (short-subunit alcohol dehydrogenase family)